MKALIVEDNVCLRTLYSVYLREMDFETDEAPDGRIALGLLQESDYDVIISDMEMPAINGMELYNRINAHKPHLNSRFVFATGSGADGVYERFFHDARCPVLTKPFSLIEFRQSVAMIAGRA